MKYLSQFSLIIVFSFLGELCRFLIPYPIPASIYGMILLFIALFCRLVPVEKVKTGGSFLVSVLPILFVAPTVSLIDCWDLLKDNLLALIIVIVITTALTFYVSGAVTQWMINRKKGGR